VSASRVCLILTAAFTLFAQAPAPVGTIQGTLVDTTGNSVPGARITIRSVDRGLVRNAETDLQGRFQLSAIAAGEWTLHAEHQGFAPLDVPAFRVSIGQTITQRWTMALSGVTTSVDVVEQPDVLDAGATSASVALGGERIEESPTRGRNYLGFVSLAPGLAQSAGGGQQRSMTGIRSPLADSGFTFAGIRPRNNGMSIDGVDNRDETTGGNRVAVGLEMVQEFRVAGISAGAEFGGAAGGLINVVTRTGVNLWHGDATFFMQNQNLNARKTEAATERRPQFDRRQPGASLLGPIVRDKTFFGWAGELEQERAEEWSETPQAVVARINRIRPGAVFSGLYPTSQRGMDSTFKFNHQINQRDTISARYSWSHGRALGDVQGPENFIDQSAAGNSLTTDHALAASWLRVVSPTVVHEFRGQFGLRKQRLWPNRDNAGPLVEIPGVVSFGEAPRLNSERTEKHAELVDQWNWTLGRHRMSAGASIHSIWFDGRLANRFAGVALFPTLEAFEQNQPFLFWQVRGNPRTAMTTVPVGLWIQERWQVNDGLLLEAGLRYDKQSMPSSLPSSPANWSPRLGLSWRPDAKTPWVLRAGYGLFADRYPLAYLNEAVQKGPAGQAIEYIRTPAGETAAQWNASRDFRAAYGRKLSIGWERGFGSTATFHVESNFVRGFHLPRIRNAALTLPASFLLEQTGRSDYRGLSFSYNRRVVNGMSMLVSYDLGRAYDDASDFDEQPSQPGNIRADWSRSRQYQAQRFSASAVVDIPIDDSLPDGWLKSALDDWMIAPAFIAGSGRPVNTLLTYDPLLTGAYPLTARPQGMSRNSAIGPATITFDARLMKTIPFQENRSRLQMGVEAFNILNHANAVRVSDAYASPAGRLPRWGSLIESSTPRQIQLFVQFEY
jgi:hypothetical protein